KHHPIGISRIECGAHFLDDRMCFWKIFAIRSIAFDEIGNGVEPQPVNAHVEPETHRIEYRTKHAWIVEIQIWLMAIEAMPEIGLAGRIPGPVGNFRVPEYDPRVAKQLIGVRPNIKITCCRASLCAPGTLKPGMLIRGMIDNEFDDDA